MQTILIFATVISGLIAFYSLKEGIARRMGGGWDPQSVQTLLNVGRIALVVCVGSVALFYFNGQKIAKARRAREAQRQQAYDRADLARVAPLAHRAGISADEYLVMDRSQGSASTACQSAMRDFTGSRGSSELFPSFAWEPVGPTKMHLTFADYGVSCTYDVATGKAELTN